MRIFLSRKTICHCHQNSLISSGFGQKREERERDVHLLMLLSSCEVAAVMLCAQTKQSINYWDQVKDCTLGFRPCLFGMHTVYFLGQSSYMLCLTVQPHRRASSLPPSPPPHTHLPFSHLYGTKLSWRSYASRILCLLTMLLTAARHCIWVHTEVHIYT